MYGRGMGTLRLPDLGYGFLLGGPNYYSEDSTPFSTDLPSNCQGPGRSDIPSDLPADGATCFMAAFPFIGKKRYGCSSMTTHGGYGAPYVQCEPVILKNEGFLDFSPLLRLGITAAIGWFVVREVF